MSLLEKLRYRRALRSAAAPAAPDPDYHSAFGGLWTDRRDASAELERRLAAGTITEEEAGRLRFWVEHGYVILEAPSRRRPATAFAPTSRGRSSPATSGC